MTLTSVILALAAARTWTMVRRDPTLRRWFRASIVTTALVALPCVFVPGVVRGSRPAFPPVVLARAWDRLDRLAGPRPARIAYAGTNLVYYLMSRGQRHDVAYVNVDAHRG